LPGRDKIAAKFCAKLAANCTRKKKMFAATLLRRGKIAAKCHGKWLIPL
jgi:hypothetical protein